jgi:hypothetical protein
MTPNVDQLFREIDKKRAELERERWEERHPIRAWFKKHNDTIMCWGFMLIGIPAISILFTTLTSSVEDRYADFMAEYGQCERVLEIHIEKTRDIPRMATHECADGRFGIWQRRTERPIIVR